MAKKQKTKGKLNKTISMSVVNPHAAGIDVGSRSHFVCVSQDNVKQFPSHTTGLNELCQHLISHGVKTVALESTGFYWQQLYSMLIGYDLEAIVVNPRHLKNVKGHKTDVVDSKWLQLLHSIGLLESSYQPDALQKELSHYTRNRRSLIEFMSKFTLKMNKDLVSMNIQLKTVLRDLTGESGLKVIRAIVSGERDPIKLETLVGRKVKSSRDEIRKALTGNWEEEHLFSLSQNLDFYDFTRKKIAEIDNQIEKLLKSWEQEHGSEEKRKEYFDPKHKKKPRQKNDPKFDIKQYAYQMSGGVDLSQITGVNINTILVLMSEVGFNLKKKFKTAKHFASWLGFAPNIKITGGKVMSSNTPKVRNPLSYAIRQAANAAGNSRDRLGDFFRRIAYKKGRSVAIVATARKIAIIIYKMLETGKEYSYEYTNAEIERIKKKKEKKIIKDIKQFDLNFQHI